MKSIEPNISYVDQFAKEFANELDRVIQLQINTSTTMEFHNEDYGALVQSANNNLSEETVDAILAKHPKSKRALVALIKLIHCQQAEDISVDDWECDMSEIVWPEVIAQLKLLPLAATFSKLEEVASICPQCENPYPHSHKGGGYSCEECKHEW